MKLWQHVEVMVEKRAKPRPKVGARSRYGGYFFLTAVPLEEELEPERLPDDADLLEEELERLLLPDELERDPDFNRYEDESDR